MSSWGAGPPPLPRQEAGERKGQPPAHRWGGGRILHPPSRAPGPCPRRRGDGRAALRVPCPLFAVIGTGWGRSGLCTHTHTGNLAGSVPLGFGCPKIRGSGLGKVRGSGVPAPQPAERGWLEGEGRALRAGKMLHRMEGWGPCRSAWGGPAHPQPGAGGSRGCCRRLRVSLGPFVLCGAVLSRGCSPLPGAAGYPELPLPAAALPHCTRAAIPRGAPAEGGDAHRGGQRRAEPVPWG